MSGEPPDPNASEVDPLVGRTIGGKFVIERLLGAGAMGAVYRAHQTALERTVAIKVMHRAIAADPTYAARFHREAKAVSRLDHPNLIRVLDYGQESDGLLYIAMEFLDGRDLFSVIEEEWPLPHERIVDILGQALSALAEAHDAGVLHRDLKPENIMLLQRKGEDGAPKDLVKVCDFGIAKVDEPEARATAQTSSGGRKLTAAGLVVGTPGYMSPEQARSEPCDGRSDIYSMGVILYQMLSRRLPFEGNTPLAIVVKALHEAPPPLGSNGPTAAPGLEPMCMKAMSKAREERYQSAREMRAALRAAAPIARQVVLLSMDRPSMVTAPTQAELVTNAPPAETKAAPAVTASSPRAWRAGGWVAAGLAIAGIALVSVTKLRHAPPASLATAEPTASAPAIPVVPGQVAPSSADPAPLVPSPPSPSAAVAVPGSPSAPVASARGPSASATSARHPLPLREHDAKESMSIAPAATGPIEPPPPAAAPVPTPPPLASSATVQAPPPAVAATPAAPAPPARPTFSLATARVDLGPARSNNASVAGSAVSRAINPFGPRFTDCYRAALAQATSAAAVHATLHLESDDQGYITTARVTGGAPEPAARCIEALARSVRIDVDTGTANADVSLTFEPQ